MVEDGNIQMDLEICGAEPDKVVSEIDAIAICAERGLVHIAYRIAHYIANRRTAMKSSVFLVPQPLLPYLEAVCVLRADAFTEEDVALLTHMGYPEPSREEVYDVSTYSPSGGSGGETVISRRVVEMLVGLVFAVRGESGLQFYPWIVRNDGAFTKFEPAPQPLHERLVEICRERVEMTQS